MASRPGPSDGGGRRHAAGAAQDTLAGALERRWPGSVRRHEPLSRHVSFRIGGPADILVRPRTLDELAAVAAWLYRRGEPFAMLGRGSNVLIADRGVRGVVLKTGRGHDGIRYDGARIAVECGAGLPYLSRQASTRGLAGLEFAGGIPGSLGGAVAMNAGAHGHCLAEVVRGIRVVTPGGEQRWSPAELGYGYRESRLQHEPAVVLQADLVLESAAPERTLARLGEWLRRRSETQPLGPPSSGCVFRNPAGDHAGRLIDVAGAKGLRVGAAVVSDRHANYILNTGGATAADVLALIGLVRARVRTEFGIELETEVKPMGEFDAV